MGFNRVIIIGEKETFIIRILLKKLQEEGIDSIFSPFSIEGINDNLKGQDILLTLYIDENKKPGEGVLNYIYDIVEKKNFNVVIVGDEEAIKNVKKTVSERYIYKTYLRPLDNIAFTQMVKSYFEFRSLKANTQKGPERELPGYGNKAISPEQDLSKSILIVDDDVNYLGLVREWLKNDYKVMMANSGMQAIKLLAKNKVDLILLDYEMPVTSGPQVLEMLRSDEDTSSVPVMFLTGKDDKESVMSVMSLRPDGYILKNIQQGELLERLRDFFTLSK